MSVNNNCHNNEDNNKEIDEDLVLSEHALNALKQFYEEKYNSFNDTNQSDGHIEEDWVRINC